MSTPASSAYTYGSEQCGLVVGYLFTPGAAPTTGTTAGTMTPEVTTAARIISSEEAAQWLVARRDKENQEFIWLHFSAANASSERWLQEHLSLPDAFYEALKEGSQSTRIEYADGALVGVINDVIYDLLADESLQVATLWLSISHRVLITVRNQPLRSVDKLRMTVKAGENFISPLDLVVHMMRDQADVLAAIIRKTVTKVDTIEDKLLAGRLNAKRENLGELRRDMVRLQRLLAPEPAALFRLLNKPPVWMNEAVATDFRQSIEEFSLALRDMGALQERIKLLQEEIAASVNERTGRAIFVLTAVTVLALPVNMVAGLFGMNVGGIPFQQASYGFWLISTLVATVSCLVAWLIFSRRDD